ncbi:MAG TPA: carbohydrate binding domain-containing protein, partial [Tepidisphaeraceae bacterium]|nr:carbohydrate binding domain-containing protein [Tepidisphaeraceae bacterium]
WHVQANQTGIDLAEGKEYTLSFQAKADKERPIMIQAMIDQDDWHAIGLAEQVDITKEFKPYTFTFKAENVVKGKNRITIQVGQEKGKVWIKDAKLVAVAMK